MPRGAGRSYGDVCLVADGALVSTEALNSVVSFDALTGRLIAQSGCTFVDLYAVIMPHGWQLPVVPGTRFLTLGGALANDIHGKNHHVSGTIGRYVQSITLWRSDGTTVRCSPTDHAELFHATIGGLGLTGLIVDVELQLLPMHASFYSTLSVKTRSLMDSMEVLRHVDAEWTHTVAWLDLLSGPEHVGRGLVLAGREAASTRGIKPPSTTSRWGWLPVVARPFLRPSIVGLANAVKWGRQRAREERATRGYGAFHHPLDGIARWNRVYGPNGFLQYQFAVPEDAGFRVITEVLRELQRHDMPVYLAVLKRFGDLTSPGWLSFPMEGWTLALDIPIRSGHEPAVLREFCDPVILETGGRIYPAKDAAMSAASFQAMYPRWQDLERLRDPNVTSAFWNRVTKPV